VVTLAPYERCEQPEVAESLSNRKTCLPGSRLINHWTIRFADRDIRKMQRLTALWLQGITSPKSDFVYVDAGSPRINIYIPPLGYG
jgi:hypothetical protein